MLRISASKLAGTGEVLLTDGMQRYPKRIFCVRHGESTSNVSGEHAIDPPLTPRGRLQAQRLRQALQHVEFDHAYLSPLARARETFREGELAAAQTHFDSRIIEYSPDPQDYASLVPYEYALEGIHDDAHNAWTVPYHDRIAHFLEDLIALPAANVLILAHGGTLSSVLLHFLAVEGGLYRDAIHHNCGIGVIEVGSDPQRDRLIVWNDIRHLEGVLVSEPLSPMQDVSSSMHP